MRCQKVVCQLAFAVLSLMFLATCGNQESKVPTVVLEDAITKEALVAHAQALEQISHNNPLSRSASSPGYTQAMDYIKNSLENLGLTIWEQRFEYRLFLETKDPVLSMISPGQQAYVWNTDYLTMTYSGIADVNAQIVFVTPQFPPGETNNSSTDGCDAADFQGIDVSGKIAVIQRGTCSFIDKVSNAESRGAVAVLIFNEGQEGRTGITLGALPPDSSVEIPVMGITYDLGKSLHDQYTAGAAITVRVAVTGKNAMTPTFNLFAETSTGRNDQVIMIGAHLDSVIEGPGINDNGSGTAALLEVARQIGLHGYTPQNKIRFAWWGAEEVGLFGSYHYLDNLSTTDLRNIAMYLNVDSIASHNFIRGVEDTDLSDTKDDPGNLYEKTPEGSGAIEQALLDYFHAHNLPTKPTPITGGTDYEGFAKYGIPFGGLYTGLDGIKTEAEAMLFGGTAGEPYDSCYHKACDSLVNMNVQIFSENARAIAHFAQYFGDRKVTTLLDKPAVSRSLRVVSTETARPVTTYRDRYHKNRRDLPIR